MNDVQAIVQSSLDISNDALDELKMRPMRVVPMETHLLNHMRYVGLCECQVLKSTGKATVVSGVRNGRP